MLHFETICFLKVDNVDIFLKFQSREFHSGFNGHTYQTTERIAKAQQLFSLLTW